MTKLYDLLIELDKKLVSVYQENFGKEKALKKTDLTNATGHLSRVIDIKMEDTIIAFFKEKKLPCIIEGEELGQTVISNNPKYLVIVDPLDGSTNFSRKIPLTCYGIAIAEYQKGITEAYFEDIIIASVRMFHTNEFYIGEKGKVTLNEKSIRLSAVDNIAKALIAIDMDRTWHKDQVKTELIIKVLKKCKGIRRFGANIIDMCYVASGKIEAMIDIQDNLSAVHTSGLFIAKEGGALLRGFDKVEFNPKLVVKEKMSFILANNQKILDSIISLMSKK